MAIVRASISTGLLMKSYAPARMAETAVSRLPNAVSTTTGTLGRFSTMARHRSMPLTPFMLRSVMTTSKSSLPTASRAVDGSVCVVTL
jgi:hypothetical protein